MTATVEVKDENWKQRELEKERKEKAEEFERCFPIRHGRRPSNLELETLKQNCELDESRATESRDLYERCKAWDERYESMKREELGE